MGRRKVRTPSSKRKYALTESVSPAACTDSKIVINSHPDKRCALLISNSVIEPNNEPSTATDSHIPEEKLQNEEWPPEQTLQKILEESVQIIEHGTSNTQEENKGSSLYENAEGLVLAGGPVENAQLSTLNEIKEDSYPTGSLEVHLIQREDKDPKDLPMNMTLDEAPACMFVNEFNPNTSECTLQDQDDDQDVVLASSVENSPINPPQVPNGIASIIPEENIKLENGAEDLEALNEIKPLELVWDVQSFEPDNSSYPRICNINLEEPRLFNSHDNSNETLISAKNSSFHYKEDVAGVGNECKEVTENVQTMHLDCCKSVAALTNQNDILRQELHGLENEIASMSCQMFDLEARCTNLENNNQQLLCQIREYEQLGSKEELLACGEQMGQFADFLQAMLEETPPPFNQNLGNSCGSGPPFFHGLH